MKPSAAVDWQLVPYTDAPADPGRTSVASDLPASLPAGTLS